MSAQSPEVFRKIPISSLPTATTDQGSEVTVTWGARSRPPPNKYPSVREPWKPTRLGKPPTGSESRESGRYPYAERKCARRKNWEIEIRINTPGSRRQYSNTIFCAAKKYNGGGGIRTHGTLAGTLVFKTSAFSRSATPPEDHDPVFPDNRCYRDLRASSV